MRVNGEWRETATTLPRPYLRAFMEAQDGSWVECLFLVDTGADRTLVTADVARRLWHPTLPSTRTVMGIGGVVDTHEVLTRVRFVGAAGEVFNIAGSYGVFLDELNTECILGYDVLHRFTVIFEKRTNTILLLHPPTGYLLTK
jgi:predicted aspartyl protease